jgi:hypothetical protein
MPGFKARGISGDLEPVVLLAVSSVPCKFVINMLRAALRAYHGGTPDLTVKAWNPSSHADVTVQVLARGNLI